MTKSMSDRIRASTMPKHVAHYIIDLLEDRADQVAAHLANKPTAEEITKYTQELTLITTAIIDMMLLLADRPDRSTTDG